MAVSIDDAVCWISLAHPGAFRAIHDLTTGTPDTLAAIDAARASYCASRWPRASWAKSANPTTIVAERIANWASRIWLESLRIRVRTEPV